MSDVKFTVNIPVYNAEKFLHRCVDSVLNQTYQNFEVILSDDGSADGSAEICMQYQHTEPKVRAYLNENRGPLLNRIFLCGKSQGDYILFLDSDDFLEPNALETLNNVILRHGCDLIFYNYKRVTASGEYPNVPAWANEKVFETAQEKKEFYEKLIFTSALNPICLKAFKAELLKNDKTDYLSYSFLKAGEDFLQSLHISFAAKKIVALPNCIYNYFNNDASLSHSCDINLYKSVLAARQAGLAYVKSEDYRRYARIVMWYILDSVKKISSADISFSKKTEAFDEIKKDPFYTSFVLKNFKAEDVNVKKRLVYRLFASGYYRALVFAVKGTKK